MDVMWSTDAHQLDREKNNTTFFLVKGFETALSVNLNTLCVRRTCGKYVGAQCEKSTDTMRWTWKEDT